MKPMTAVYNVLNSVLTAQSKHVTEAKAAKPLKKAEFSCPFKAKGSEFSLGYARASILPDDVNKKKYYKWLF